jgi:hypothetical protein
VEFGCANPADREGRPGRAHDRKRTRSEATDRLERARQPDATIFSRAALDRKAERVKPLRLAAASIASSKP